MNKTELSRALAETVGLSRSQAYEVVDALFNPRTGIIAETVRGGGRIALQGFGSFSSRERSARVATNPRTRARIQVPARRVIRFAAGKSLRNLTR